MLCKASTAVQGYKNKDTSERTRKCLLRYVVINMKRHAKQRITVDMDNLAVIAAKKDPVIALRTE